MRPRFRAYHQAEFPAPVRLSHQVDHGKQIFVATDGEALAVVSHPDRTLPRVRTPARAREAVGKIRRRLDRQTSHTLKSPGRGRASTLRETRWLGMADCTAVTRFASTEAATSA